MKHLFLFLFLAFVCFVPLDAQAQKKPVTKADQAIMIDFDTGTVLYEKEAQVRMPTSSMSKVMTMYVVFEALKNGQISLDDKFTVSEKAWRKGGSKMFVEIDKSVRVEDLIRGVIIQSGNDATIVLAEGLGGTEEYFAKGLNAIASKLGMSDSHFVNASGWPDPDHYSTAADLAKLTMALIKNFPEYYHYYGEKEFTYNDITQKNRNPLLYRNIGADGVKTGHTEAGGYGLIGAGLNANGRRVVLVVNGLESEKDRAQEAAKLMEWGLRGFQNMDLFKADEVIETAEVAFGKKKELSLVTGKDVSVSVPTLSRNDLKVEVSYKSSLKAPIEKGTQIGTMKISIPMLQNMEIPLLAGEDVREVGVVSKLFSKARIILTQEAQETLEEVTGE